MKIEKLNGTDKRLYQLIAPFAMNSAVIRQNGGVPITTSDKHIWYVAIDKKKVIGFLSLNRSTIKNDYYNNLKIFEHLLNNLLSDYPNLTLKYVASIFEMPVVSKLGFTTEKTSTNYFYTKHERKEAL
jgi:hypothetical protein